MLHKFRFNGELHITFDTQTLSFFVFNIYQSFVVCSRWKVLSCEKNLPLDTMVAELAIFRRNTFGSIEKDMEITLNGR